MQETQETWVRSLGQEDALEKEMAIHSSISCLENSMNKGAWQATLHGLAKSKTWLSTHVYMSLHILTPCTSSPTNHTYTHYHIHTTLTHIKMSSSMAGSFQYTGLQINVFERGRWTHCSHCYCPDLFPPSPLPRVIHVDIMFSQSMYASHIKL